MKKSDPAVDAAMDRLRAAALQQRAAIEELIALGAVRSRSLVGDLGERLAADYYGVELDWDGRRGSAYDLTDRRDRRIEVKTLRATPSNWRTSIGPMLGSYDALLAIRLDEAYLPLHAIEVPRAVLEEYYPAGKRVSWTKTLERDDRVRRITGDELLAGLPRA